MFLLQTIIPSDNWDYWNNYNVLWSMSCFAFFYLIVPWIYKVINKFSISCFITFILIIINPWIIDKIERCLKNNEKISSPDLFATSNPLTNLYCFMFGVTVYLCVKESKQNVYAIVVLIFLLLPFLSSKNKYEILFTLILIILTTKPLIIKNNIGIILSKIADCSFIMYLVHPIVLDIGAKVWRIIKISNKVFFSIWLYLIVFLATYIVKKIIIDKITFSHFFHLN